jgi:1-acyl-sn-glycerol-3-phosphate acyltransferase
MDSSSIEPNEFPPARRVTTGLRIIQWFLGFGANLFLALPYLRLTRGMARLDPSQRYLFVCNHVSLLDTILLGALCWRAECYPIIVLGDKSVWHSNWFKKLLSSKIGFLLERGKTNPNRINELEQFGHAGKEFHLVVFPEGTRGDGVNVAVCQPGIYHIAQTSKLPIVPVFIENMQLISTKTGRFHPFAGVRKVEVHFGAAIPFADYAAMRREEFTEFVRGKIAEARMTVAVPANNS